jgi:hypothetical protein
MGAQGKKNATQGLREHSTKGGGIGGDDARSLRHAHRALSMAMIAAVRNSFVRCHITAASTRKRHR